MISAHLIRILDEHVVSAHREVSETNGSRKIQKQPALRSGLARPFVAAWHDCGGG